MELSKFSNPKYFMESILNPIEGAVEYYKTNNIIPSNDFVSNFFKTNYSSFDSLNENQESSDKKSFNFDNIISSVNNKIDSNKKNSQSISNSNNSSITNSGKYIIDFFINKGLSKEQSAGIAGNLKKESNFKTNVWGDNNTSYGVGQWRNERKDNLINFAKGNNLDSSKLDTQLEFIWYELNTTHKNALASLKQTSSPEDAAFIFADKYERPATNEPIRQKYARDLYNQ